MKVAVYMIVGAGEKNLGRAIASAAGADVVTVVFTTPNRDVADAAAIPPCMRPQFHEVAISPFRFDDARNAALALVPDDIDACIALDADETLEPGWREALDATMADQLVPPWSATITFNFDGQPFLQNNRVHSRRGWRWRHPCHEALVPSMQIATLPVACHALHMTHRPDVTKPRPNYLELLAWGQHEDPTSQRMLHYYGRQLMFAGYCSDALERFETYLERHQGPDWVEVEQTRAYVAQCREAIGTRP